jgi:hypothetical protein
MVLKSETLPRWVMPAPGTELTWEEILGSASTGRQAANSRPSYTGLPVSWVGAHGGAGTSSLCTVVGIGNDCDRTWPKASRGPIILVARTHASGLASVRKAIAEHPLDPLFAVVLVAASARRVPKALGPDIEQLAQMVPHLRQVGWIEDWRTRPCQMTRKAQQALAELTDAPHWARDELSPLR